MFRFILGLISGIAVGAAAANLSQGQSGQDLRAEFERIRSDLQEGNFEALGSRLEERFKELQVNLEQRFAEVQEAAAEVSEDAEATVQDAADEAADAAAEAVAEAEEEAEAARA